MAGKSDIVKGALDLTAKLLGEGGEQAAKTGIRAYQGSPHNFAAERLVRFPEGRTEYIVGQPDVLPDVSEGAEVLQDFPLGRMRMDKIGTGEGAQAYGYGLYAAENERVAKGYRDALTDPEQVKIRINDKHIPSVWVDDLRSTFPEMYKGLSEADQDVMDSLLGTMESAYSVRDAANAAESVGGRAKLLFNQRVKPFVTKPEVGPGHMYEVNIAADPNQFLDWDKPLSEQSEAVKTAFQRVDKSINARGDQYTPHELETMGEWYNHFKGKRFNAPQISESLKEVGIPGIKYLDAGSRSAGEGSRNYVVFDDKLISIIRKYGIAGASAMLGYNLMENLDANQALAASMADQDYKASIPNKAYGGYVDDDIDDAIRIAKDVGGSTPVMMEDAKGNKYDAQGNVIPPTNPGPNPARSDVTPETVAAKAVNDPATFDALMERYAVPDRDIAQYEATKKAVAQQPYETQQMTHVGAKPERDVTVDMPLFGGEYSLGKAPYDVAGPMAGMAQTAYDWKTAPFYALPLTAPLAAGMDVAEGVATEDPLTASLAIGFGPGGKYAKAAGIGAANYLMAPEEAEAGPARWFSKAMEVARNIPMNKMTGEQALAMLRKSVSPEELKWTGADVFLPQQKQITKQDLVDYLGKNRVQTSDVVLGGSNKPTRMEEILPMQIPEEIKAKYRDANNAAMKERVAAIVEMNKIINPDGSIPPEKNAIYTALKEKSREAGYRIDEIGRQMRQEYVDSIGGLGLPTKYQDYATPGGQDYRETLIRLGSSQPPKVIQKDRMWHIIGTDGETMRNKSGGPYIYYTQADAERAARSMHRESGKFTSQHWNEPDVIGHIRSQILDVTPEGANRPYKAFNVDETQSDWAQAGRKRGFSDEELPASGKVPTAPYVGTTQGWTDLSIKKALDQALDAGADYFTYTPGEVHADRYNLSKSVSEIRYAPSADGKTVSIEAYDKNGDNVLNKPSASWDEAKELLGEEITGEIKENAKTDVDPFSGYNVLSGLDLKTGGEGMIDYYNNIYKKRVEKVVKDATGKKVQWEVIPVQTADGPREQLGFRLTDDMKEARFSDFNKGGRVADPTVNKALALTSGY